MAPRVVPMTITEAPTTACPVAALVTLPLILPVLPALRMAARDNRADMRMRIGSDFLQDMINLQLWNSGFLLSGGDYNLKTPFFQLLFITADFVRDSRSG